MVRPSLSSLTIAVSLTGCSLVGEPRYLRMRPGADSSVEDTWSIDSTLDGTVDEPIDARVDEPVEDATQSIDQPLIDQPNPRDIPIRDVQAPDVPTRDVPNPIDASLNCNLDSDCSPSWCGCGQCNAADIVCAAVAPRCNLGCPMLECPALATTGCQCQAGRCVRRNPFLDASADVSAILMEGEVCGVRGGAVCGAGLMCCYPCGVPGCESQCTRPIGGRCPMPP